MLAGVVHAEPSISSLREALSTRDKAQHRTEPDGAANVPNTGRAPAVTVREMKLKPDEPIEGAQSSTLMFDVYNEAAASITDVVVSVSLLDATVKDSSDPRIIVGPFKIRLKEILLADYSVHYELRLRNLSSDCGCVPAIEVLDARVLVSSNFGSAQPPK